MGLDDHYKVGKKRPLGRERAAQNFLSDEELLQPESGKVHLETREGEGKRDPISNGACEGQKSRSGGHSPLSDP